MVERAPTPYPSPPPSHNPGRNRVIGVTLNGIKRVLFEEITVKKIRVVCVDPGRYRRLGRPLALSFHDAQLGTKRDPVGTKIQQFVLEIESSR